MIDPANARGRVIETYQYQAQQAKMSPESMQQLRQVDANQDGALSIAELKQLDADGDGQLSAQESTQLAPQDRNVVNRFLASPLEPTLATFDLGIGESTEIETLIEFEAQAGEQVADRSGPVLVSSQRQSEQSENATHTEGRTELAELNENYTVVAQGEPVWSVGIGNTPDRARMSALADVAGEGDTALSGYSARTLPTSELRTQLFTEGRLDSAKVEALMGQPMSPEALQKLEVMLQPIDGQESFITLMASQPGELVENTGAEGLSEHDRAARAQALVDALGPEATASEGSTEAERPRVDPVVNQRWEQVEEDVQHYKLGNILGMLGAALAGAPAASIGAMDLSYVETIKEKVARPVDPQAQQEQAQVDTAAASDDVQSAQNPALPPQTQPQPPVEQREAPLREYH